MIPEKYIELMNAEIDGVNDPEGKAVLDRYLGDHPEARAFFLELESLASALNKIPDVEPPDELKKQILNSLRGNVFEMKEKPGIVQSIWGTLFRRPSIRYALSFVAGLGIGMIALAAFWANTEKPSELDDLYGTMMQKESSANLERGSSIEIALGDISGTATLKSSPQYTIAEVKISSLRNVDIVLEYNGDNIKMSGIGAKGGLSNNVAITDKSVRVAHEGTNTYMFAFTAAAHSSEPLNFKLMASGNVLYEHKLSAESEMR